MMPITKKLILDKWSAFRSSDWATYNHLKHEVKEEVKKAKQVWANKLLSTTNGLLKLVAKQQKKDRSDLSSIGSDDFLIE